ncbi:MAG: NAD(P)/FAD-dependent oxidoreductase [Bauldia sp.]
MKHGEIEAQEELRAGQPPWPEPDPPLPKRGLAGSMRTDVAIVGAGVSGAMAAEAMTAAGLRVAIVERDRPAFGSTAASTALLLWELDATLLDLSDRYGPERAARCYLRSHAAMLGLRDLVAGVGIGCNWAPRTSLYLAPATGEAGALLEEHRAREAAGLPGTHLDADALAAAFAMRRAEAILSADGAEADPVALTAALLRLALGRGADLIDGTVVAYHSDSRAATLELADGRLVEAGHVVIATGYDMPDFLKSPLHEVRASWCIATPPQRPDALWPQRTLLWEHDDPYLYARTTPDGRILVGGEDETMPSADAREALTSAKAATLAAKMAALWPGADYRVAGAWSAAFGTTADGLPLIGRVPGAPRLLAAFGYSGNGITFSFMASRILRAIIAGEERDWFADFAIDREGRE